MEQLYSIGQVSKLKGVSPRMLRYYDKLGILAPCSVDNETGYRRYTLDQMVELDVIRMCIAAGIPLPELSDIQRQQPEVATLRLLEEARERLRARIEKLERTKLSIDDYLAELGDERAMPQGDAAGFLPSGVAVALPWKKRHFDGRDYLRSMTGLEEACRKLGLAPFLKRGIAFAISEGQAWSFIEVASVDSVLEKSAGISDKGRAVLPGLVALALPEGRFEGAEIKGEGITDAFAKGFDRALALAKERSPNAQPASITLTERWGTSFGQDFSSVLLRVHEQDIDQLCDPSDDDW